MKFKYSLLFAIVLRHSVGAQDKSEIFELQIINNNPIVQIFVNNQGPFNFMVDTGASGIGRIDVELAKKLALSPGTPEQNDDGHNVRQVNTSKVAELRLGKVSFKNMELITRDYNGSKKSPTISGVLGREFFAEKLLIMNFKERKLIIKDAALTDSDTAMSYEKPFIVTGYVGGRPEQFYFDTGSTMTFHFPKKIAQTNSAKPTGKTGQASRANTTFEITEAILETPIRLGRLEVANQLINYSEPAKIINIGTSFLSSHILTIDQKNKLIKLE